MPDIYTNCQKLLPKRGAAEVAEGDAEKRFLIRKAGRQEKSKR